MLATVTTALTTPEAMRWFVETNLAAGVDHVIVVLDAPGRDDQGAVAEYLSAEPRTSVVLGDRDWWLTKRPARLNVRQRINANAVLSAIAEVDEVDWLFHIDSDEVVAVDRRVLGALSPDVGAVRLTPLEAPSSADAAERPRAFKRLLSEPELSLLNVLGVLSAPTNQAYFHGHVLGKSGVRPTSGLRLTLHDAVTPDGGPVPDGHEHRGPGLDVLHFDAVSLADFERKWTALAAAGPVGVRPDRRPMAEALRWLLSSDRDLPAEVRRRHLREIYDRTTADDVGLLSELGLLVPWEPPTTDSGPGPADARRLGARIDSSLDLVRGTEKEVFHVNHAPAGSGRRSPERGAPEPTPPRRTTSRFNLRRGSDRTPG